MKVYLVEDWENSPGKILAVFARREDAEHFAKFTKFYSGIEERSVWEGQPPSPGFNP